MNRSKILEFFDAEQIKEQIHVVGVGVIGSNVVEQLVRMGVKTLDVWDFDTVSAHNIANQMFIEPMLGMNKCEAIAWYTNNINPECKVNMHTEGLKEPYILNGYVFLCVDSIDLRREIVEANKYNLHCLGIMDFRMRLTDAQMYFASNDWQYEEMLKTMQFTHEEAAEATPTSACGVTLSVCYAPKTIVSFGVSNFVHFIKQVDYANLITIDMDTFETQSFKWKERKKKETLGILDMLIKQ